MLEGYDAAPLIDCGHFTPDMIAAPEAEAATLDAALREAARAERADAAMLDLWLHRPGGANLSALERPGAGAQTSWHALAAGGGGVLDFSGGKDVPLVAAYGGKEDELEGGVVKGPKSVDDGDDGGSWGYGDGSYPGGPTGPEVGDGGGGQLTEPAKDTPCVETAPSNVALQELNNQALQASNEIAAKPDQNIEYGVIFYMLNGMLQRTAVFDSGQPGEIDWNIGLETIPSGAVIVGTLHSHPDIAGINDGIPSYTNIMEGVTGRIGLYIMSL